MTMKPAQIIENLQTAITQATELLNVMKAATTSEGWSSLRANGTPPTKEQKSIAPRHGCEWNWKERRDLVEKWLQFASLETLSQRHHRTEASVRSELQRLLNTSNIDVLLDEIVGAEE